MGKFTSTQSEDVAELVQRRLDSLTKPRGSLGRMEELALEYAVARGDAMPLIRSRKLFVFCADHGITEEGVSPFPSVITRQMAANFVRGGAAINALCRHAAIESVIVDMGIAGGPVDGALDRRMGDGTRNFLREPAMTRDQAEGSITAGRDLVRAVSSADIIGLGEMGIGNTTTAAALLCVFTGADPSEAVGPGAGAADRMISRKAQVIRTALELHRPVATDPVAALAAVGGFEMGAIAGCILEAAALRIPVVLDGFPGSAGALVAQALNPDCLRNAFFGHASAEPGHRAMLAALGGRPILEMGMRLGEGTGAALAIGMIDASVRLYREMATFEEAALDGHP